MMPATATAAAPMAIPEPIFRVRFIVVVPSWSGLVEFSTVDPQ
jgi:hypothetical protein